MKRLDPDKLTVEFRTRVTMTEPVIGRKYTLTHSDITAELFLTIGLVFAYDKVSSMRDEVLAHWRYSNGEPLLYAYVYVDGQPGSLLAPVRNMIFRRELPLALEAIRYGDRALFAAHPELDEAPIWIHFDSASMEYSRFEYWGMPKDYR